MSCVRVRVRVCIQRHLVRQLFIPVISTQKLCGAVVRSVTAGVCAISPGYPVMIKASAGGGGKGMRIAWTDEETRYVSFRMRADVFERLLLILL